MFEKVLIANRGEIAIRVMRACRELDIKSIAIYSDADKTSLYTNYADESYPLGNPSPAKSYLNIEKIIDIALESGADAIHPGYGFLSENADFADACDALGIKFIGPSSDAIRSLGDKATARKTMREAGVPITPGSKDIIATEKEALKAAKEIGYPVIIKASAGGGGKGMRIAHNEDELIDSYLMASNEAKASFNNPDVYMERYIENPRHIEVQILGDQHGNVVHLFERDCSLQRRHQKLLEEAPSPTLDAETRRKMGEAAVKAAKAANYSSAGTIEFIMTPEGEFFFMEMNTRIQVEHPVTEMISGQDLIKEQFRIASGEQLSFKQEDLFVNGHSIECRINAEDSEKNFMPCPGKVTKYIVPGGNGIRVDSAVYEGYTILPFYDSMIAKLIVHGKNRQEAINKMKRALGEFVIEGVKTTIPFHQRILEDSDFLAGNITTHFIEKKFGNEKK
jgi:acetyl-CoA carboxylase biotin carboxylase subunit